MRNALIAVGGIAAALLAAGAGAAAALKIGLIMSYSGQFADPAAQMDNAIKLYVKQKATRSPAGRSNSSARTPAASRPTSPSGWRRSWSCATAPTSSRASC